LVVASCTCDYSFSEPDRDGFFALSKTRRISTTNHERKNVENLSVGCLFLVIWVGVALVLAAFGPTMLWVVWVGIRCFGCCCWRFRPYGEALFPDAEKVPKNACRNVRPARWGSGFLRYGIDPGAAPPVCFAAPPLAVFGCAKRSLRSHHRINPSTQPADAAGESRSKAAAELTLILLSGEKQGVFGF
jgi:hypothetical protein